MGRHGPDSLDTIWVSRHKAFLHGQKEISHQLSISGAPTGVKQKVWRKKPNNYPPLRFTFDVYVGPCSTPVQTKKEYDHADAKGSGAQAVAVDASGKQQQCTRNGRFPFGFQLENQPTSQTQTPLAGMLLSLGKVLAKGVI